MAIRRHHYRKVRNKNLEKARRVKKRNEREKKRNEREEESKGHKKHHKPKKGVMPAALKKYWATHKRK